MAFAENVHIALGMPSGDGQVWHYARDSAIGAARKYRYDLCHDGTSAIPSAFGLLWCWALNGPFTHFAMLHGDVAAEPQWLDKMVDELESAGLDLLSAVVAIKSDDGITSTAVQTHGDSDFHRRIALAELQDLPRTFGSDDLGYPGCPLLVNTGCWVARIRQHVGGPLCNWARQFPGFAMDAPIMWTRDDAGREVAYTRLDPEDWRMSRWLHNNGVKYAATQLIETKHCGRDVWSTAERFGFDTDVTYWKWYEREVNAGRIVQTTCGSASQEHIEQEV